MIERHASVQWRGNLTHGIGFIDLESGQLIKVPYSYSKRFSEERGTNPEELLAASLSSCFAMTMAKELEKTKLFAENIDVFASVIIDEENPEWSIRKINLEIKGFIPKSDEFTFQEIAKKSLMKCPLFKILKIDVSLIFNHDLREYKEPVIQ